ncbi:unnamed protein product [Jaminaea pallidilutea]
MSQPNRQHQYEVLTKTRAGSAPPDRDPIGAASDLPASSLPVFRRRPRYAPEDAQDVPVAQKSSTAADRSDASDSGVIEDVGQANARDIADEVTDIASSNNASQAPRRASSEIREQLVRGTEEEDELDFLRYRHSQAQPRGPSSPVHSSAQIVPEVGSTLNPRAVDRDAALGTSAVVLPAHLDLRVPDVRADPGPSSLPMHLLQPSPPRRNLRTRKPDQLHPYTMEMAKYQRRLKRNDWDDAIVTDARMRKKMREEREEMERAAANDLPLDMEGLQTSTSDDLATDKKRNKEARRAEKARQRPEKLQEAASSSKSRLDKATRRLAVAPSDDSATAAKTSSSRLSTEQLFGPFGGPISDTESDTASTPHRRRSTAQRSRSPSDQESQSSRQSALRMNRRRRLRLSPSSASESAGDARKVVAGSSGNGIPIASHPSASSSSSSSESEDVDYERYFRQLKRMMPIGMARKYIDDLKAMRKGKAYHSDGHVSSTPEPSSPDSSDGENRSAAGATTITPATSPPDADLRPGETRKRQADGAGGLQHDARFDLVGDSDSDGENVTSGDVSDDDSDPGAAAGSGSRWWSTPAQRPPRREVDAIDRMLSRAGAASTGSKRKSNLSKHVTSYGGPARPRPRTSVQSLLPRSYGSSKGPLRERQLNEHIPRPPKRKRPGQSARAPQPHRSRGPPAPTTRAANPPIAHPRVPRPLDLRRDEMLFDVELLLQPPQHSSDEDEDDGVSDDAEAAQSYARQVRSYREHSQLTVPFRTVRTHGAALPPQPLTLPTRNERDFGRHALDHTTSREAVSTHSPRGPSTDHSARRLAGRVSSGDFDSPGGATRVSKTQLDADAWAAVVNLRLDFGIRPLPSGVAFDRSSNIGRGRLYELLKLQEPSAPPFNPAQARTIAFDVSLPAHGDYDGMLEGLPPAFDCVFRACEQLADRLNPDAPRARSHADDVLRHYALGSTQVFAFVDSRQALQYYAAVKGQVAHLLERLHSCGLSRDPSPSMEAALLGIRWFEVETAWRTLCALSTTTEQEQSDEIAEEFLAAAQGLMLCLLSHGMHKTVRQVKQATTPSSSSPEISSEPAPIADLSAELWVNLIHILEAAAGVVGPHVTFWKVFEATLSNWVRILPVRRPVLVAEAIWFSMLSLCALSQFSASNGTSLSTPLLKQQWSLVAQAVSFIRIRYDEAVEQAMPSAAVYQRDQYVRAIVQRCCNLVSLWHWDSQGADAALAKIFDIFNSHKLTDLPSEQDHDFPPFLRDFDTHLLYDESRRETTVYHVFLKLLAQIAQGIKATAANATDGDRKISRLFSRLCPVRVMTFSKTNPPTARERSCLFNHYAVAMLHLFMVPSAATQRLRQVKSFLNFKDADAQSQVTCIRAMMYAAVIHQHYQLDLTPIASWLSTIFRALLTESEDVNRKAARNQAGEHFETLRQAKRVNGLIVAALRSIQHIIHHRGLDPATSSRNGIGYPDPELLNRAWIADLLKTETAVDPYIGGEVLKCINEFLRQRNIAVGSSALHSGGNATMQADARSGNGDSQDEFGEIFGDGGFDFADPALESMLQASEPPSAVQPAQVLEQAQARDRAFAEEVRDHISPALFALISNLLHPDRAGEGRQASLAYADFLDPSLRAAGQRQQMDALVKRSARKQYLELLIDCWAGCAHVVVQNGLREWDSYFTYGNESWQRIGDAIGKRDVGLRFMQNVAMLDSTAYARYQPEFVQIWFQGAAARSLSIQADLAFTLFRKLDADMPWFKDAGLETQGRPLDGPTFENLRPKILATAIDGMRCDYERASSSEATKRRSMVFACLSGFLASMRAQIEALPTNRAHAFNGRGDDATATAARSVDVYLDFCRAALTAIEQRAGETIMRGLRSDVERTKTALSKKEQERGQGTRIVDNNRMALL